MHFTVIIPFIHPQFSRPLFSILLFVCFQHAHKSLGVEKHIKVIFFLIVHSILIELFDFRFLHAGFCKKMN